MFRFTASSDTGAPSHMAGICVLNPNLSDATIARRAATTWRCSCCGHIERHDDPAELRERACWHAREHAGVMA